jgi:hypothetical protein
LPRNVAKEDERFEIADLDVKALKINELKN